MPAHCNPILYAEEFLSIFGSVLPVLERAPEARPGEAVDMSRVRRKKKFSFKSVEIPNRTVLVNSSCYFKLGLSNPTKTCSEPRLVFLLSMIGKIGDAMSFRAVASPTRAGLPK